MKHPETPIRVELLYFDGCPYYGQVWSDLAELIAESKLDARAQLVKVSTQAQADALHFAGSPSVKVNGRDLEGYEGPGVLACRLYGQDAKGRPSRELLRERLLAAANTAASIPNRRR